MQTNALLRVSGKSAHGTVYGIVTGYNDKFINRIVYHDQYVKKAGKWLFKKRVLALDSSVPKL